ncbi:MAG: response regulator transcription factor [Dehalococcoidales bacterium]|nr:response regulator transcription factor [Dehalococcoidales bacterium]
MRILVIEDNQQLADLLNRGLSEAGYAVDIALSGEEGEEYIESVPYDLLILDIILPGKDGIAVCRGLRQNGIKLPILMLTAKNSLGDKIEGLDSGADDYLVKPFEFEELYARIRALLRREENLIPQKLQIGSLVFDTKARQVWCGQTVIELTSKEFAILEYLARHPNLVITRTMLEQHVWNLGLDSTSNLIDVYISRLRRKIDIAGETSLIQTVKGVGYRLAIQ